MQHGLGEPELIANLLQRAGFELSVTRDRHLCCGSAGSYSLLQPDIAGQLGENKAAALEDTSPEVIASSNLGCITQLGAHTEVPVVHLVELIDWATGGERPAAMGKANE